MPSCIYIMDKIKKKKTNKKRGKTHALSIGNLRKTELNCAQCQKQLFGLWKNESFQSCLECSSKKSNVLSMLKSMNRVCEVRVSSQVMDNTVLMRTLSNEGTEMEQSKDEENDYIGRNIEMNEKRYARDSENKNVSPDFKEEKIAQRTRRRSLNLRNQTDEYKDNCKSNHISNDPMVSINNDKLSSNNEESNVTQNVESDQSKTGDSIIKTRRKSSLAKMALEESPRSDVAVDFKNIQENTRNKRGRPFKRHTQLSVESNLNENKISLQSGNRRRQQLPVEENCSSKLAKGKKKGKESEEVENDDSSNTTKMSKHEPELHVENKDCNTKDKSINFGESRKRRQTSAFKEVLPSESLYEEICDNRNPRKSGRIHRRMSPEDKSCDDKNKKRNQTDEVLFKQRSIVNRNEMKRLKIDMESYHISGIERVKRRSSSRASQNTSPNNNKNLDNCSVDGSRRRTRASLNVITDKTTMETEHAKCTVLDDRLSSTTQGLEHHSEDEKQQEGVIKENKLETKKLSETELLSKERRKKQKGKRPIKPKLKPPIPARTLELLRSTRGLKPIVLVEKMITVKRKVAHQPARNEKKGRFLVDRNKKRTVCNFNKKYDTSNAESLVADKAENKTISVSEKNRKAVSKEDNNIGSKQACEPKQKLMTLRRLRNEEYNQNKLLKLNRNNVRKNKGRRKMQVIKKYQSMRTTKSKKKKKTSGTVKMRMTVSKETKQIPRYFPCEKCKKQFVNVLQQKAHELTHRGYFELKLKRIDSDTIQKTEGEIISKDIVNYILKSVFSTETDNISEVCRDDVCDSMNVQPSDHTDVHSNVPEETYNATGTRKYELRQVKVILKRIDLREAIAMNKCNESVLVATNIVNNILQNIDDKTVEGCIYTQHEAVNVDSANKTREAEFYVSELEENNSDEHFSQEVIGKTHLERKGVEIIDTDPDCEETANQSWERKHSENHNETVDNSEVISNNGSEQNKHENNHMLESEDIDNINEGAEIDETESSENQLHKNIDYNKQEHYNDKSAERTDNNLDRNLLIKTNAFNNEKLYSVSSNISDIIKNKGIETLNAKTSTLVDSNTEFLEDTDTFETSKDNETDSSEPDACNVHTVENEYNTSNEIEEITMNTSAGESDKSPDGDRRICEYSDIMLTTRSEYNEKMLCEAEEVDNELHKEEVENGKSSELLNVTSNEEVYSSAVTSDMDKADSDNSLEDYDCGVSDTTIQSNADTSESQQSGDEVDIVETNKSLSVCSSDDNSKSGDISFESSVVTNVDNNDEVLSEGKESMVSDSDKMTCKDKESIVSIQDESSVSKLDACEYINEKDCSETSSEKSYVAADSSETVNEQMLQNENGSDEVGSSKNSKKIFNEDQVITKPDNYKAYSCDMEDDKPENSEIDKSDDTVFNKPYEQEVQQTHTSLHNKENSKSVSDNDTINDVALTHISANIENCYAICKQETNSLFMKTHSSDEHHILALSETSDKSDAVVSQNTDTTTTQHDSLDTKHFNIPQDNIKNETNLNKLKNVGDSSSEFVDDIENKSTGIEEEDESRDRTISDGSDSHIFMTTQPSDNEETILHNASNNFAEIKITEGNDSEIDNENKRIIENTLENDAASESNYKSMEKYLESFIKDFIVRSTERNETNIESNNQIKEEKLGVNEEIEKLIADATPKEDTCTTNTTSDYDVETEKLGIDVVPTDGRCTTNTASDYVVTEKSGINVIPTEGNSTSDYEAAEKSGFYNDSLQNMTGMLFEEICLSSNMERKSQNANQKEPLTQNSSSATVMTKNQIQLSSREETNDRITGTEAAGDMYRLSGNKNEIASPASYVSDTTAMTNCRLSVSDITKPNAVGQFCHKSVTDFSATMEYSMSNTQPTDISNTQKQSSNIDSTQRRHSSDFSNTQRQLSSMNNTQRQSSSISNPQRQSSDMSNPQRQSSDVSSSQRQSSDRTQTPMPSSSNHITFTIQKQSYDRRDPDLTGTSSSHIDHSRRYSGDRWQTESSSDSIRRHSNDRREVDYSTSGTSNTYQRSVTDNRRHYTDSHESRPYESRDPRENRGNLYGQNWRHPVQNRTHPYQHNPHKRNDRGGYSNWRWPGSNNNYSHYRQSNNWR